jgi:hypothetical protein
VLLPPCFARLPPLCPFRSRLEPKAEPPKPSDSTRGCLPCTPWPQHSFLSLRHLPLSHSIQPRQAHASAPPLARRAPAPQLSVDPPTTQPSCSPAFTLRSHGRRTTVEAPPTRRDEEAGAGMGLLSNRVERSEIRPGDHIYTWRAVYAYSHHGTLLDPLLCGPDCAAAGAVNSHWCSTGSTTQFVDLTGILGLHRGQCARICAPPLESLPQLYAPRPAVRIAQSAFRFSWAIDEVFAFLAMFSSLNLSLRSPPLEATIACLVAGVQQGINQVNFSVFYHEKNPYTL